jgi:hypothetical protein
VSVIATLGREGNMHAAVPRFATTTSANRLPAAASHGPPVTRRSAGAHGAEPVSAVAARVGAGVAAAVGSALAGGAVGGGAAVVGAAGLGLVDPLQAAISTIDASTARIPRARPGRPAGPSGSLEDRGIADPPAGMVAQGLAGVDTPTGPGDCGTLRSPPSSWSLTGPTTGPS